MRRIFLGYACLVILSLAIVCCQDSGLDPQFDSRTDFVQLAEKDAAADSLYLQWIWDFAASIEHDTLRGTIDVDSGGTVSGVPESWPENCVFSVTFPPGTVVEDFPGGTVDVEIHIPVFGTEYPCPAVPYDFEPSMTFTEPVTAQLWWPYDQMKPNCSGYTVYYVEPDSQTGELTYGGLVTVPPDGATSSHQKGLPPPFPPPGPINPITICAQFTISLDHFSRWVAENGSGGGPGGGLTSPCDDSQ